MGKQLYTDPMMEIVRIEVNIICGSSCTDPDELFELDG